MLPRLLQTGTFSLYKTCSFCFSAIVQNNHNFLCPRAINLEAPQYMEHKGGSEHAQH